MKNTLRILSAVLVLSASAATVQAQGGGGGGGGGQQMTPEQRLQRTKDMLFKDITLTPAQVAKADTILMAASTKQREAMQAAQAGGGDMTAAREAMTKLTADRNAALKAILSSDADKAKFDANIAAMPQGRGRGGR
jgi:Spy/CpxP family protein refolding chaperone